LLLLLLLLPLLLLHRCTYHSMGGLQEGLAVELANGSMAVVVEPGPCRVIAT
jgi:hypothetical protein